MYIYYYVRNRELVGTCGKAQRAQLGALWGSRVVGWGGEKETQKEGDICLHIADLLLLLFCTVQTNKTLQSNAISIRRESIQVKSWKYHDWGPSKQKE